MLTTTLFAPRDTMLYPPCGMFTVEHFIALFITLLFIGIGFYLCRDVTVDKLRFLTKIVAIVVTVLEAIKITYNFAYGYTWPDAWVPLAFCSLFIYASWLAGFGKGIFEKLGKSFLIYGCPTAGFLFLIFPTTSLQLHPIYHYLCLYSMLFHGAMLWLGILHILHSTELPFLKTFIYYAVLCTIFAIPSIILNSILGCNMMFLNKPFNVPLEFISQIYEFSHILYMILIFIAYLACSFVSFGIYKLSVLIKSKTIHKEVIYNEL